MLDGPCAPWTFPMLCDVVDADDDTLTLAKEAATFLLWALGGRRHGTCPLTLRPCRPMRSTIGWPSWGHGYAPVLDDGVWLNVCGHEAYCACEGRAAVRLDAGPVSSIAQVRIDGAVLPAWTVETGEGWRYDGGVLYRLGGQLWPATQRLDLPATEAGTWAVDVLAGLEVDALGLAAAGDLACQVLLALTGDLEHCRLPKNVVSVVRAGVSSTFADPSVVLTEKRIGLPLADQWINAVNPERLAQRPAVYSPDRMPPRRG